LQDLAENGVLPFELLYVSPCLIFMPFAGASRAIAAERAVTYCLATCKMFQGAPLTNRLRTVVASHACLVLETPTNERRL
jgi:hypothetical protein